MFKPGDNSVGPQVRTQANSTTSGQGTSPDAGTGQSLDDRSALVQRISASAQFRRAAKLREFLAYVAEQTLQGNADSLNEQQIGRAVFGRAADYSPSEDNVVRAHARQLRVKLGEYFSSKGKSEPLILEIPKGSYVPVFSPRPEAPAADPAAPQPARPWNKIVIWAGLALLVLSIASSVYLAVQNRTLQRQVTGALSAASGPVPAPLAWVFDQDRAVSLVVADSCFGLMQDLAGKPASLEEYLDPEFWQTVRPSTPSKDGERLMHRVRSRELTSYADVLLATKILRLIGPRAKISFRFARDVRPRELNTGNFIFLGSSYANPWVSLYDRKRNFRIQVDANLRQSIVNKAPRPGELGTYVVYGEDGAPGATYGLVNFFPSDGTTGNVLIIEGTNMEGTEAAGNLILDPKSAQDVFAQAGISDSSRSHSFFELLIESKVLAGEPSQTRVVAWRK